ncbi:HVA22-like protein e [Cinnamomum micranthum f. kanehirae]|uniref:HVA22-like protein n=1 Tax=Cinnamomum micranthum f. kanehirae TaxID=337451 RepID=A0A443P8D2_9MAGN|nr:HVA22-like protein e [Cinnamomum micranthum f. kanehirae]
MHYLGISKRPISRFVLFLLLCHEFAHVICLCSTCRPTVMLLYPLYASVQAIESPSKLDDEQWLAYWILYSFLTLIEMMIQPLLKWVTIWYPLKVAFVAWLVLPQFKGAAFIYEKFVREQVLRRYSGRGKDHVSPKGKKAT